MQYVYDDGGRSACGYKGNTRDCVVRAIAIATMKGYETVKSEIDWLASEVYCDGSDSMHGVKKPLWKSYLKQLGWIWVPTMFIGQGCKVHLRDGELPMGRLVVSVSRHLVAVIDGVLHDTCDCSRGGMRCVYGYYFAPRANAGRGLKQLEA